MKAWKFILSVAVATVLSIPSLSQSSMPVTRHALIISVSKFSNSERLGSLPAGTARNARDLATALVRGGFHPTNVTLIGSDEDDPNRRPTRAVILSQLQRVARSAQSEDTIVAFMIGHGREVGEVSFLCPSDATDAALDQKTVADRELIAVPMITELLKSSPALNKLLVVDACRDTGAPVDSFVRRLEQTPEGVCVMTSCSQRQFSYMSRNLIAGDDRPIFTHFIAEGLAGDADLVANNDGIVSLFELFSYTYRKTKEAAAEIGQSQDPELFTGISTSFPVSFAGSFAPRTVTSSDPLAERRQTALLLADRSLTLVREGEYRLKTDYDDLSKSPRDGRGHPKDDTGIYRDHHNRVCYALGNYIKPALVFDPDCRVAHLARGFSFRSCGAYREALADYKQAHEHFELFVKGDPASVKNYLEVDAKNQVLKNAHGQPIFKSQDGKAALDGETLVLYAEPNRRGGVVGGVSRQAKVRIEQVSNVADSEWLLVTAINDQPLPRAGWLPRGSAHWFAEAADLYTPSSPMNARGGMRGSGLGKLDQAAAEMHAVAYKLDAPTRKLEDIKAKIDAPFERASRIPFAGGWVQMARGYATGPISTAQGYTSIPGNYVRMAAGYVEMPANVARMSRGWAGTTQNYYASMERTEKVDARRTLLLTGKFLEPVTEERVTIENTPWQVAREVVLK